MTGRKNFNHSATDKVTLGHELLNLLTDEELFTSRHITAAAFEEKALKLIERGADLTLRCEKGATALHYACMFYDRDKIALALIKHGADINIRDDSQSTPLIRASFWAHPKVIHALLDAGADVTAQDNSGHDACYYLQDRRPEILEKAQRIQEQQIKDANQPPAPEVSHLDDLRKVPAARDIFKKKN